LVLGRFLDPVLERRVMSVARRYRTAAWTAQQVVDTFPDDSAPPYLLRDRDSIYAHHRYVRRAD
jgi:hypothetical protein